MKYAKPKSWKAKMSKIMKTKHKAGVLKGVFETGHKVNTGRPAWNKGKPHSEETKKKLSKKAKLQWQEGRVGIFPKGEDKWNWKGGISKPGVRQKIQEEIAGRLRPKTCEVCYLPGRIIFDHDHSTGKFRGWICSQCNLALGHVKDNIPVLLLLAKYLKKNGK